MGLCALGDPFNQALVRGVRYLIETQNADGSWSEEEITGTGFPKVFYLKYDMYRNSWPLVALGTYQQMLDKALAGVDHKSDDEPNGHPARNGAAH
jgi:squalene-hopene/tetraprenyl-beta-curcumene cyclase